MTLKLGRVGTDIALADPDSWSRNGNQVTLGGYADGATTVADGITLSEQLLGLVDSSDEPVVACAWSEEAWFDGYYVVKNVDVGSESPSLSTGWFPYRIQLQRVADGDSPRVDSTLVGALLANANSVTSATLAHRVPGDGYAYYARGGALTASGADLQVSTTNARTSETGALMGGRRATISAVTNGFASFECAPSDYYDGACVIRSGTTLRRVIGNRLKRLPTNWEIGNGLIRITPTSAARIITEVFNGATWEDSNTYWFGITSNLMSPNGMFTDISVLRNSPEHCIIRLALGTSITNGGSRDVVTWDIGIRRGSFHATIRQSYANALSSGGTLALGNITASAATAITGGIRQTSNSAAGNRWVLAAAHPSIAKTNDLTQGAVSLSAAQSGLFMVGYEFDGSSAATNSAAQDIVNEFYYPLTERMVPRIR